MAGQNLNHLLERLNLLSTNAVFFIEKKSKYAPVFTPELQHKLELIRPDAYYSFNCKPYILFFDLSENISNEREEEIHKQVWSFDSAPVIFIIKKDSIEVFNAFYYQKERNRLEKISVDENEIIEQFSFWNIQSGNTWQWLQAEKFKDTINKKRVNQRLFDNIKAARENLEHSGLTSTAANITILRLIFIRYLIDRGVGIKKEFISGSTIFERRKSLSDLILNVHKLSEFFEYLNDRFNGTLFKQKSSFRLRREQALFLSQIFDVRKDKAAPSLFDAYFFDVFDFSIIPVEVISGIYESVIDDEIRDKDSAIYTPPFLVEYILGETVDKYFTKKRKTEFKVLDPACGSGIFLVQSYRRMVDEEIRRNKHAGLESSRLREIAENNLFGIDVNEQALLVASFSIYIAILDYKEPKEINTFKFPNLINKNLFVANFFDTDHEYNQVFGKIEFDFILGNPPWRNKKDDTFHTSYLERNDITVGRYEIAQSFLYRTRTFMTDDTESALIVTSTIFYNISSTTKNFKTNFLENFSVKTFFDLSAVRRLVFESAISPAAIIIYKKSEPSKAAKNIVKHYSIKSNIFLKHFKTIVIEKFDQKEILQRHFIEHDWMFKVALYGGSLDYFFLKRIGLNQFKLNNLIDNKTIFKGAGIKSNSGNDYAEFLINLPLLENKHIQDYYTSVTKANKILKPADVHYESGRNPNLFYGNRILIKEQARNETDLVISYNQNNCVYKNGVWGIASKDANKLKEIYAYLISTLYTYYIYMTSCSWGISTRPQIRLDEEYLSFPLVKSDTGKREKLIKLVSAFLNPLMEWHKDFYLGLPPVSKDLLAQINCEILNSYEVTKVEEDLIDYTLNVSRYQFQEGKQDKFIRTINNDTKVLKAYAEVFFDEMNDLYLGEFLQAEIYPLNYFIAINFKFVPEKPSPSNRIKIIDELKSEAQVLSAISSSLSFWSLTSSKENTKNIFIQKDIKGFEKDSFYIIKPNEYKCWHRAMAWYDAAEIKGLIEKAELETLIEYK